MQIANKVIIITGGSNGIGRALSLYFISRKAKAVVIADVSKPNEESKGITYFNCDVTSSDQLRQLFLHTLNLFGQVDILVHFVNEIFID